MKPFHARLVFNNSEKVWCRTDPRETLSGEGVFDPIGYNRKESKGTVVRSFYARLTTVSILVALCLPSSLLAGRRHGDVENIGNRNINGRVALIFPNFVSLEKEIQIGAQYAQYFEQTARLVEDPVVNEFVDRVGQNIVKNSDAKVPFVIKVIDTDEVNAFALPGGYFYVNKGLILEADTEAELAGVMAHEIAHVAARHATERMTKAQLMQFAALPALFVGGYWTQMAVYNSMGMGLSLAVLGITRKSEEEADQLGTQYLWNTGYDPNGFITFFEKLQAREKDKPGKFASFWRTHPAVEDRIEKVQQEISYLPPKDEYVVNTSEFKRVKARLVAIDNRLAAPGSDSGPAKRPTLKRRTNTDRSEREEPTLQEDRPTLRRPSLKKEGEEDPEGR
jgi:beta-barrel assembly-enhancing protease